MTALRSQLSIGCHRTKLMKLSPDEVDCCCCCCWGDEAEGSFSLELLLLLAPPLVLLLWLLPWLLLRKPKKNFFNVVFVPPLQSKPLLPCCFAFKWERKRQLSFFVNFLSHWVGIYSYLLKDTLFHHNCPLQILLLIWFLIKYLYLTLFDTIQSVPHRQILKNVY